MSYKTIDELPADIKKQYSEADQEIFLAAYNKKVKACEADGDACDEDAMDAGHAAVKSRRKSRLRAFVEKVENLVENFFMSSEQEDETQMRAVSIDNVYQQVWQACDEHDPYCWLNSIYYEDDGQPFAVITSQGKLFRADLTITDGMVALGAWVEVKIDFPPVTQARTVLQRQADGRVRWFSVAASNALNRSGEIDSQALFESFVAHIEETGEYPVRQFYHAGGVFRTGQHDFVATFTQDGVCLLITSGLYDDTELARREIAAREAEPEYWGNSIGFLPTAKPEMLEVADGVEIPVYTRGIIREESTLPEASAAAWMTAVPTLTEVTRMLQANQMDAFVKLFNGDEAAANAWLEANAAERARKIADAGMITRDAAPVPETPAPETSSDPAPLVLDEAAVGAIARAIVESEGFTALVNPLTERMTGLETRLNDLTAKLDGQTQAGETARAALETRLKAVEATDEEKRQTWLADLPAKRGVNVTYRPRQVDATPDPAAPTMSDIATETLKRAPVSY